LTSCKFFREKITILTLCALTANFFWSFGKKITKKFAVKKKKRNFAGEKKQK